MIKSFPNRRRRRDIAQIQNPISEDRTREILDPDPEPTRFVIKLNPATTLLDYSMIEDTNIALLTLKSQYNQIQGEATRNVKAMQLINNFLKKLEDANYFQRMPVLLQAIQAIAKGTLMHNFVNATSINSAIIKLSNQVSHHTGKSLSVKKLADLYTLPASFLKRNQQYHILLNIPISHTINVHTYQLDKISYLFIRNSQPYYLTINPDYDIIAPTQGLTKDFVFKQSDLASCLSIRHKRYCPLTIAQPLSIHRCLVSLYKNIVPDIINYCPISITKIRKSKTISLGQNAYQTVSTVKQQYSTLCKNSSKTQLSIDIPPNIIYQFELDKNCSSITTDYLSLFHDATDIVRTYRHKDLNVIDLVNTMLKNYPLDISALFNISNTRSLESLLDAPYAFSHEESINLVLGIALSSLIAIFLFTCQYFCKSRSGKISLRIPVTRNRRNPASNVQEFTERPDHADIIQRLAPDHVAKYSPAYDYDAKAPDYTDE